MSDTPRTDALLDSNRGQAAIYRYSDLLDHAITLERALVAKTAQAEALADEIERLNKQIDGLSNELAIETNKTMLFGNALEKIQQARKTSNAKGNGPGS